jgi:C-terminal processing protease CtpA/Prc
MPRSRIGVLFCLARFSLQDKSLVLLTQGLGNQPFHGRIVVLVNEWTNSAGEIVAQFAKDTKLAIVVGKQTRGNVLGSTTFDVGGGYRLYLPIFGWYGVTVQVPTALVLDKSGRTSQAMVDDCENCATNCEKS